jgi:hypothetical protein
MGRAPKYTLTRILQALADAGVSAEQRTLFIESLENKAAPKGPRSRRAEGDKILWAAIEAAIAARKAALLALEKVPPLAIDPEE